MAYEPPLLDWVPARRPPPSGVFLWRELSDYHTAESPIDRHCGEGRNPVKLHHEGLTLMRGIRATDA